MTAKNNKILFNHEKSAYLCDTPNMYTRNLDFSKRWSENEIAQLKINNPSWHLLYAIYKDDDTVVKSRQVQWVQYKRKQLNGIISEMKQVKNGNIVDTFNDSMTEDQIGALVAPYMELASKVTEKHEQYEHEQRVIEENRPRTLFENVSDVVLSLEGHFTTKEIMEAFGDVYGKDVAVAQRTNISGKIKQLVDEGKIVKLDRGTYRLAFLNEE